MRHARGVCWRISRALVLGTCALLCAAAAIADAGPAPVHFTRAQMLQQDGGSLGVPPAHVDSHGPDGTWTEVASEDYERTGFRRNDLDAKYTWIRANSGDQVQAGLKLRNAADSVLDSVTCGIPTALSR